MVCTAITSTWWLNLNKEPHGLHRLPAIFLMQPVFLWMIDSRSWCDLPSSFPGGWWRLHPWGTQPPVPQCSWHWLPGRCQRHGWTPLHLPGYSCPGWQECPDSRVRLNLRISLVLFCDWEAVIRWVSLLVSPCSKDIKRLLAAYTTGKGQAGSEAAFALYSSEWESTPSQTTIKRTAVDIGTDYIFLVPIETAIYLHAANARSVQGFQNGIQHTSKNSHQVWKKVLPAKH